MNNDVLRIGVKNLGLLTLDEQCRRCYWLALRVGFGGVWEKFGPIYGQIDSFLKRHVSTYIEEHGEGPPWLPLADKVVRVLHIPKVVHTFPGSKIEMRGAPDAVFELVNGSIIVVDFKTGKPKYPEHPWFRWYAAQLCMYGHTIEESHGLKVARLYMCNAVVQADKVAAADIESRRDDGFVMRFKIENVEVPIDYSVIPNLALAARHLRNLEQPPAPKAGCKDCARIQLMYETLNKAQASLVCNSDDQAMPLPSDMQVPWDIRTLR